MKQVRLKGPMESIDFMRGLHRVTFQRMVAKEVEDDFAAELVGKNPDGFTVEQAALYCVPVFEVVTGGQGAARKTGGGEEVVS